MNTTALLLSDYSSPSPSRAWQPQLVPSVIPDRGMDTDSALERMLGGAPFLVDPAGRSVRNQFRARAAPLAGESYQSWGVRDESIAALGYGVTGGRERAHG